MASTFLAHPLESRQNTIEMLCMLIAYKGGAAVVRRRQVGPVGSGNGNQLGKPTVHVTIRENIPRFATTLNTRTTHTTHVGLSNGLSASASSFGGATSLFRRHRKNSVAGTSTCKNLRNQEQSRNTRGTDNRFTVYETRSPYRQHLIFFPCVWIYVWPTYRNLGQSIKYSDPRKKVAKRVATFFFLRYQALDIRRGKFEIFMRRCRGPCGTRLRQPTCQIFKNLHGLY
jgi:hypothetical protein